MKRQSKLLVVAILLSASIGLAGLEFQVTRWLWSDIGWRYLKFDYTSGGFTNKTELNGPFINTGINL